MILPVKDHQDGHKVLVGRWRREAFEVINDNIYWLVLECDEMATEPMMHFDNAILKRYSDSERVKHYGFAKLGMLVVGTGAKILGEFVTLLLDAPRWQQLLDKAPDASARHHIAGLGTLLTLQNHCQLSRRVVETVGGYKFRYFPIRSFHRHHRFTYIELKRDNTNVRRTIQIHNINVSNKYEESCVFVSVSQQYLVRRLLASGS